MIIYRVYFALMTLSLTITYAARRPHFRVGDDSASNVDEYRPPTTRIIWLACARIAELETGHRNAEVAHAARCRSQPPARLLLAGYARGVSRCRSVSMLHSLRYRRERLDVGLLPGARDGWHFHAVSKAGKLGVARMACSAPMAEALPHCLDIDLRRLPPRISSIYDDRWAAISLSAARLALRVARQFALYSSIRFSRVSRVNGVQLGLPLSLSPVSRGRQSRLPRFRCRRFDSRRRARRLAACCHRRAISRYGSPVAIAPISPSAAARHAARVISFLALGIMPLPHMPLSPVLGRAYAAAMLAYAASSASRARYFTAIRRDVERLRLALISFRRSIGHSPCRVMPHQFLD